MASVNGGSTLFSIALWPYDGPSLLTTERWLIVHLSKDDDSHDEYPLPTTTQLGRPDP